jgi:hypothetical protein
LKVSQLATILLTFGDRAQLSKSRFS